MQSACMFDFLSLLPYWLRVVVCFGLVTSTVPLFGLMVFGGDLRATWRYTKQWLYIVGGMALAGAVIALLFL